jgi:glutamate racemase
VGGLTVVRALMERLPLENIVYFGDTARVPYGIKSVEVICHYARQITEFLLHQRVKLLIIACNTMAAVARQVVDDVANVPVLDVIDAGARTAVAATRLKAVAVIGTPATINSNAYARAIHQLDPDIRVFSQSCPLFVPLVEEGWLDHEVTRLTAQEYLRSVLCQNLDTLVLGCTHYPLLKPLLRAVAGEAICLVDSAEAMAGQALNRLREMGLASRRSDRPAYTFYVTDVPYRFQGIGERFLGRSLSNVQVVKW